MRRFGLSTLTVVSTFFLSAAGAAGVVVAAPGVPVQALLANLIW